jgi:hypothetical protein
MRQDAGKGEAELPCPAGGTALLEPSGVQQPGSLLNPVLLGSYEGFMMFD